MGWKCKISRIVLAAASAGSLQIAPAHAALITYDFQGRFYASFDPTNQISRNGVSVSNGFSGTVTYNTNAAPTFPNNSINTAIYYGAITSFSVSIGSYSGIIQNSFFPNTNNFVVIGDNQPQGDFVGLSSNVQSSVFSTNSRSISQLLFVDPTRSAINTLNIPSNIYKFPDPNFSRFSFANYDGYGDGTGQYGTPLPRDFLSLSGVIDSLVLRSAPRIDAILPTNAELAQMSVNAYDPVLSGAVGSFNAISGLSTGSRTDQVSIYAETYVATGVNGGRDQVVIAIRGSRPGEDFLLRNGTFLTGNATQEFKNNATEIANLIARAHQLYKDADFTLTGHSLGGGLAQAVGDATGIRAIGFDAPGANGVLDTNEKALVATLAKSGVSVSNPLYSSSTQLTNIRYYGDVVSTIGAQYNVAKTIIPSDSAEFSKLINTNTLYPGSCFLTCHDIKRLATELGLGAIPVDVIPDTATSYISPIFSLLTSTQYQTLKLFKYTVNPSALAFFDPAGSGNFIRLDMLDSDVDLGSVFFPGLSGNFEVFTLEGNDWLSIGSSPGFSEFSVKPAKSYLFSNADALKDVYGNFLVGLRFASSGTFRGSLSTVQIDSGVPEPNIWIMLVIGFGIVGGAMRRRHSLTVTYA